MGKVVQLRIFVYITFYYVCVAIENNYPIKTNVSYIIPLNVQFIERHYNFL